MELSCRLIRNTLVVVLFLFPSILLAGDKFACASPQPPVPAYESNDPGLSLNASHPLFRKISSRGVSVHDHGYAVEILGDYSTDGAVKTAEEKEALVARGLQAEFSNSFECKLVFSSENTDFSVSPEEPEAVSEQDKTDFQLLIEDLDTAMLKHRQIREAGDDHPFKLGIVAYRDVQPQLNAFKDYSNRDPRDLEQQMLQPANSGAAGDVGKIISVYLLAHGAVWYTGNWEMLALLGLMDVAGVATLAYRVGYSEAMTVLVASLNAAALNPIYVAAFSLYLQVALDETFKVTKNSFDELNYKAFLEVGDHQDKYKDDEGMKAEFETFIGLLKGIKTGTRLKRGEITQRSEFAGYRGKSSMNALVSPARFMVNAVVGVASAIKLAPIPSLIAAQGIFNELIHYKFGQPLSDVLFPESCAIKRPFLTEPLEHICYQARWVGIDAPGYALAFLGAGYTLSNIVWGILTAMSVKAVAVNNGHPHQD